ncbi:MAG: hypothetical protein Q9227_003046 [Pyrenula ochraceoflavens]
MADYSTQQNRSYGPRSTSHGHPTNFQRDAAYADIFGGAPNGRSQTMTSQPVPMSQERAHTMGSQTSNGMVLRGPPPVRHLQNGYDGGQLNGYYPGNGRQPNGTAMAQQPPQNLPPPMLDRRPYPQPQRMDPRQGGPLNQYSKVPNRVPPPALNSDPYRSQSMATSTVPRMGGPTAYQQPPSNFNHTSASAFRQQQYHSPRTTSMGRQIPERHDERTMSLSSYSAHNDNTQLGSGRVIPGMPRRQQMNSDPISSPANSISPPSSNKGSPSPQEDFNRYDPNNRPRRPSEGSIGRAMSMASTTSTLVADRTMSLQSGTRPNLSHSPSTATTIAQRRAPLVYPALLSRVAGVFRERIGVGERSKNDLTYKNAFTGTEAVDLISYIIKTTDRNLALLLGRALDAQKFFHDVEYNHRLRDASGEIYQFKETIGEEPVSSEVNGVFTLLSECYSPTCTRDQLCYSIACPRRLEQQARLNLRPEPGLRPSTSKGSLHGDDDDDHEQKLWINSVPKEIAEKTDDREKKRQEVISEIMYTERDFVKDLEYLRDYWVRPLRNNNPNNPSPIPPHRQEKFIRTVFGNFLEVHAVNARFSEKLTARQKESAVVENIGDIFLEFVPKFDPFIKYGANQMYGKYEFEREKSHNIAFARFVDETERLKESRKLELNGYLTKPTTRLARYPLLLDNVLKYSKEGNPDRRDIPEAIKKIKDFLGRVNAETGKAENHFNLVQLSQQLKWNPGEFVDLKLTEENRQILTKMAFKKSPTDNAEITVYLFDHAILPIRIKTVNKREEYRVYRKPIPLELCQILEMEQVIPRVGVVKRPSSSLIPGTKSANTNATPDKQGFPITFKHLGRGTYELPVYANSQVQRKKFIEKVEEQQTKLRQRNSNIFTKTIICESFFTASNKVNCLVPSDGGRKLVFGTENGIFLADRWPKEKSARPKRILDVNNVTQIDTLEEYQLLLVLANKTLSSYPLEALDVHENQNPLAKRPKKIQGHSNFFKAGIGLGRHLVCSVKTSALSTTIKVYEPDATSRRAGGPTLGNMFRSRPEALKPFKEFYIPAESSSVHFLRSTLCVGCAKGFEVVSLETTERQSLLDQADTDLDFVARRENVKPIHIERLNGEFLLNYSDFSFFVNRNGWRARPDWKIQWEGQPESFALSYPYILAFEPNFIEIRHIETSELIYIMTGRRIRMLHSSTREVISSLATHFRPKFADQVRFCTLMKMKEGRM